jgi:hypothetical protein
VSAPTDLFNNTEMQKNAMCFDEVQDETVFLKSKKTLLASFSVLYKICF